jgi:hypothetical protein
MEWLVVVCFGFWLLFGLVVAWFGCVGCWLLPYRYQVEGFGLGQGQGPLALVGR